jgi:hypothetical protein
MCKCSVCTGVCDNARRQDGACLHTREELLCAVCIIVGQAMHPIRGVAVHVKFCVGGSFGTCLA